MAVFDQLELVLATLWLAPFRPVTFGDDELPAYQITYLRDVLNPLC
jgi:hypothetical protein